MVAVTHPLVAETLRKAAVAWVAVGDRPARALWCMPMDGALWVVTGPGEQDAPGLPEAERALVTLRGDHGGRVVTWPAKVSRVEPGSQAWAEVVPQLAGKRLNAPADAATLVERWAAECTVLTLTPEGEPVAAGPTLPDTALAEPPRARGKVS